MGNVLLKPTRIYTLGDYYKSPGLREECHRIKEGDVATVNECAGRLAEKLPADSIIVPVPSISGANERFARMVAYYANVPIYYALAREVLSNGGLYRMKKNGLPVTENDTGIFAHGLPPEGRIVLVDNVIATGTTMSASILAIGRPCAAATIAVDYDEYERITENI